MVCAMRVTKPGRIASLAVLLLLVMSLMPSVAIGQPLTAQPVGGSEPKNVSPRELLLAKARVLNASLSKSLNLNTSDGVRKEVNELLRVSVSEFSLEELREWVNNASKLLASIADEVREGRAYRVGIALQRYLEGLRNALEQRVRVLAERYNITVSLDEVVANAYKARDVNQLIKAFKDAVKEAELRNVERIRECVEEVVRAKLHNIAELRNVERIRERVEEVVRAKLHNIQASDAVPLKGVDEELRKCVEVLGRVRAKLEAVNASQKTLEALGEALSRVEEARELVRGVAENVPEGVRGEPEEVRVSLQQGLRDHVSKVNQSLGELLEELETLKAEASAANLTDLLKKIDYLIDQVNNLKEKIDEGMVSRDTYEVLGEIARIKSSINYIEREIERATECVGEEIRERVKELAGKMIDEASSLSNVVRELLTKVKSSDYCDREVPQPPQPICKADVTKLIMLIEERVSMAEELIRYASNNYTEGNYVRALTNAAKALGILKASKAEIEAILRLATALKPQREVTTPARP